MLSEIQENGLQPNHWVAILVILILALLIGGTFAFKGSVQF